MEEVIFFRDPEFVWKFQNLKILWSLKFHPWPGKDLFLVITSICCWILKQQIVVNLPRLTHNAAQSNYYHDDKSMTSENGKVSRWHWWLQQMAHHHHHHHHQWKQHYNHHVNQHQHNDSSLSLPLSSVLSSREQKRLRVTLMAQPDGSPHSPVASNTHANTNTDTDTDTNTFCNYGDGDHDDIDNLF